MNENENKEMDFQAQADEGFAAAFNMAMEKLNLIRWISECSIPDHIHLARVFATSLDCNDRKRSRAKVKG